MSTTPTIIDPYQHESSIIHRLDARIKLPLVLGFLIVAALMPSGAWSGYILLLAIVISAGLLSHLGMGSILKRSLLAVPFVFAALPILFTLKGPALFSFTIGSTPLTLTTTGLERFLSIGIKSWISIQAAILLAACTRLPDLLTAMRWMHLPRTLAAIIGLMWRYLFVIVDEASRLTRARQARSGTTAARATTGNVFWRAKVTGGMAGSLLMRSIERSERVYSAMLARGYNGEIRTLPHPPLRPVHIFILVGGNLLFLLILAFGILVG